MAAPPPFYGLGPSSILLTTSGNSYYGNPAWAVSGYNSFGFKESLLAAGSGLITANFADFRQDRDFVDNAVGTPDEINFGIDLNPAGFQGEGINRYYPSPKEYAAGTFGGITYGSGIYITYPPASGKKAGPLYATYSGSTGSGIFNFKEFISNFSNAKESKDATSGINNFTIFNPYIHYLPDPASASTTVVPGGSAASSHISIPFVADLIPTDAMWDRYRLLTPKDEAEEDSTDPADSEFGDGDNGENGDTGD